MPSHTAHTHHTTQKRVLVDRDGIMHDPDYRAFMPATSYASSSRTYDTEEIQSPYEWHYTPRSRASPCPSYASSSSLYGAYPTYTKTFAASYYYDELLSEEEPEEEGEADEPQAYKPEELSMKETVRRQLQTVSFTVGIKVFRARRRLRRVLHRNHGALA